jgi:hypothetical protein
VPLSIKGAQWYLPIFAATAEMHCPSGVHDSLLKTEFAYEHLKYEVSV